MNTDSRRIIGAETALAVLLHGGLGCRVIVDAEVLRDVDGGGLRPRWKVNKYGGVSFSVWGSDRPGAAEARRGLEGTERDEYCDIGR